MRLRPGLLLAVGVVLVWGAAVGGATAVSAAPQARGGAALANPPLRVKTGS